MRRRGHGLINTALRVRPGLSTYCARSVVAELRGYSSGLGAVDDVAILGGGITGLATAYYLTRELPKVKITIYEASNQVGGWLLSKRVPVKDGSILFEAGPRTLRPQSNGVLSAQLLQELDLAKDAIFPQKTSPAARNRYIYYPDHLVRMPHPSFGLISNVYSLLTEPVFEGAAWAAFTEIGRGKRDLGIQDESVGDFFSRRLSKTLVDRILSGVLHGIYAGDAWKLSAKSLFPSAWRDEADPGSLTGGFLRISKLGVEVTKREAEYLKEMKEFQWDPLLRETLKHTVIFTFKDGLSALADKMARYLMSTGNVTFKTSTSVKSIGTSNDTSGVVVSVKGTSEPRTHSTVISALPPAALNSLHEDQKAQLIPHIPSVTVMTVNLYYRTPDLNPAGFGYLIPQGTPFENNPERALGVIFDNAYSPSPKDVDRSNWHTNSNEALQEARDQGQLVNVNDFAWYNLPNTPNMQDDVKTRGTKLTVMLGGHWWDGWPAYPDEKEGLALAKSLLERHLGIKEEPEAWQVNLQKDCIPQYTVGHEQKLKQAHNNIWRAYNGKLRVAGNWISGVGVNDALRSAWDVVRDLKNGKSSTGLDHIGTNEYLRIKPIGREPEAED